MQGRLNKDSIQFLCYPSFSSTFLVPFDHKQEKSYYEKPKKISAGGSAATISGLLPKPDVWKEFITMELGRFEEYVDTLLFVYFYCMFDLPYTCVMIISTHLQ